MPRAKHSVGSLATSGGRKRETQSRTRLASNLETQSVDEGSSGQTRDGLHLLVCQSEKILDRVVVELRLGLPADEERQEEVEIA